MAGVNQVQYRTDLRSSTHLGVTVEVRFVYLQIPAKILGNMFGSVLGLGLSQRFMNRLWFLY